MQSLVSPVSGPTASRGGAPSASQPPRDLSMPGSLLCRLGLTLLLLAACIHAQPVRVTTEFARFTATGDLFPDDGIKRPLEVLSPPLVRGVWNAFRVVIDVEPGQEFRLHIGQNPAGALRVRAYREVVEQEGEQWRIVRRQHVLLPFRSESLPEAERPPTRTTYTLWLEVQPPADFRPRRMKLEPQLLLDDQWFVYPMEVRIPDLSVSLQGISRGDAGTVDAGEPGPIPDRPYTLLLAKAICAGGDTSFLAAMPSRGVSSTREWEAVSSLARSMDALSADYGREEVDEITHDFLAIEDTQRWCAEPQFPRSQFGPEWPTVLRNRILRLAGDPD